MTRRLTLSGSRSEMGLPLDFNEPVTPPPSWTPAKDDTFWRKPSKWQICMPRLRFVAKLAISLIVLIVLFKVLGQQQPSPPSEIRESRLPQPPGDVPMDGGVEPTEEEMLAIARKEAWLWKDFPTYVSKVGRNRRMKLTES